MDMSERDIRKDLQTNPIDAAKSVVQTGLQVLVNPGGVPVGTGLSALLEVVIASRKSKMVDEWLVHTFEELQAIKAYVPDFDWRRLFSDPAFIDLLLKAAQMALLTHRDEKLLALKNAVLNSAVGADIEENVRFAFLGLIDRLTTAHLDVLFSASNIREWAVRNGYPIPPESLEKGITVSYTEWQETIKTKYGMDLDFLELVLADLRTAQMIEMHPHWAPTGKEKEDGTPLFDTSYATVLGHRFVEFITTPKL